MAVVMKFVAIANAPEGTVGVVTEDAVVNAEAPEAFTASISYE
jgi:hypothetical protein